MDIVVDQTGSRLHHIGGLDIQLGAVGEERIGIELRDLHHRLFLALGALEHLILALVGIGGQMAHIGDVHNTVDIIADKAQILLQHILHNIGAQVADMGKMIHGGAAGIHLHMAGGVGFKFFFLMGCRIIQIHSASPYYNLYFSVIKLLFVSPWVEKKPPMSY